MAIDTIEISSQYKYKGRGPLDAKTLVNTYDELTQEATWQEKKSGTNFAYNGMVVSVGFDKTGNGDGSDSKNGVYFLHDPAVKNTFIPIDVSNEANWHKLSSIEDLRKATNNLVTAEALEAALDTKVDSITYLADKATFITAGQVNTALARKANVADVVSNDTFETFKAATLQSLEAKADIVDVYTKSDVDTLIAAKANSADVYSKIEVNAAVAAIGAELDKKAYIADVYTKEAADVLFITQDNLETSLNSIITVAAKETEEPIYDVASLVKCVDDTASKITAITTITADTASKIAELTDTVSTYTELVDSIKTPKPSDEVTMAEDGTLGLGEINVDKLVQTEGSKIILDGGDELATI